MWGPVRDANVSLMVCTGFQLDSPIGETDFTGSAGPCTARSFSSTRFSPRALRIPPDIWPQRGSAFPEFPRHTTRATLLYNPSRTGRTTIHQFHARGAKRDFLRGAIRRHLRTLPRFFRNDTLPLTRKSKTTTMRSANFAFLLTFGPRLDGGLFLDRELSPII